MPADFSYDDAVRRYGKNNVEKCEAAHQRPGLYRVWVKPDCRYRQSKMPFSEVNMHMRILFLAAIAALFLATPAQAQRN